MPIPKEKLISHKYLVSVANSSTTCIEDNIGRVHAILMNDSDETIYLALGEYPAVVGEGIRLNANGGSYEITSINQWRGKVSAICTSGSKDLTVTEVSYAD